MAVSPAQRAMVTIAKNRTGYIDSLFTHCNLVKLHCLENYFIGQVVSPDRAKRTLFLFSFAKLKRNSDGTHTVKVHGNEWYDIS